MRHPLLRGANAGSGISIETGLDSSPPARGKLSIICGIDYAPRFIPSCEGQTDAPASNGENASIHPLLRGADLTIICIHTFKADSSPPARGRLFNLNFFYFLVRFIPSCEGQTPLRAFPQPAPAIHPLLRGADEGAFAPSDEFYDSSPPARGRPWFFWRCW